MDYKYLLDLAIILLCIKSAGAFDKKGTDAAGRWRASGRITVGTCRSRHS